MKQIALGMTEQQLDTLLSTIAVGGWDWDLSTGKVIYSNAWANTLGYAVAELPQTVETWAARVLPEDLAYANQQINRHLSGELPFYEAEFRMRCKDGSIIWTQDKGRVISFDAEGKPLRFVGVLQNVTRLKAAELSLLENRETLDMAVSVAGLGTWDWDIPSNTLRYNDEYLRILGYTQEEMQGTIGEWESMNHPEDLPQASARLEAYLAGQSPTYECEVRMRCKDGSYIWTRDVGRVVERDRDGTPVRMIGGHLNIDALKRSEARLREALKEVEQSRLDLEETIKHRTRALVEQGKMLWTVNQISKMLLTFSPGSDFAAVVQDCLRLLGESIKRNRVYIWRDYVAPDGDIYCTQIYEWVAGATPIQGEERFEGISYTNLPNFSEATSSGRCLNRLVRDLSEHERLVLEPQGIRTILIAPVSINGTRWGFIGVDNCENDLLFTEEEENMLAMSGSMLANAIERMNTEEKMREMEARTQIMLDATPLCCNLWTPDLHNMSCNEEAVRLFDLSSQMEYLARFHELSPEVQPNGRLSSELARECVQRAFRDGYARFEWMHQKLDGTPLPSEVTLVRIRYKDGFIVAGYTRDMREQKKMLDELQAKEDALRVARDEALLSSKAKSNFLANMSHEIRTPMNAISGLAEIIARESPDGKAAEYAKGIKNACATLLNIINDVLDISKIESGKLEIVNAPYDFASLLNDVITISRMRLGDKPLMFITDIDSRLPARMIGDEIRIRQVLINMLSNAIKFTQRGHIALRVSGRVNGDQADLCIEVSDSGTGILPEDMARLFVEFERVNTTRNRTIEGTGLGLAISKQLCEMMGGTIEVESTYGQGSCFTASFPQSCPEYQPLCQVQTPKTVLLYEPRELYRRSIIGTIENLGCTCVCCKNQSELYETFDLLHYDYIITASLHLKKVQALADLHQLKSSIAVFAEYGERIGDDGVYTIHFPVSCLQLSDLLGGGSGSGNFSPQDSAGASFIAPDARVLLVDDNPVNLTVAAGLMAPYRFSIDTACNGLEAVDKVKRVTYDLVFMDHMMPEMDGIDATTIIRRLEGDYYRDLPIVALTANALVGTREMFLREGMNDFLAKPIELNKLNTVLAKWLPKSKCQRPLPDQPVEEEATPALEEGPLLSLAGLDTAKGIMLVGGSREQYRNILAVYHADGMRKLPQLHRYVAEKDIAAFRTEIHALKSTSATIGADDLSGLAAKLETAAINEDLEFIEDKLELFLTKLQLLLEAIGPVLLPTRADGPAPASIPLPPGTPDSLSPLLDQLAEAAEFASIARMEETLFALQQYIWPQPVSKIIDDIRNCLSVFDYDGVCTCVTQLRDQQSTTCDQ